MSERLLREFRERAEHLVPMPDLDQLQRRGTRLRRVRIAAGAAVVASALAIGGVVVTNSIDDKNAVAPATGGAEDPPAPNGAMYLPPEGATPSNPASGELIASMETRGGVGVYVYADGRLIWKRPHADHPTGWAEQRLTPEGVQLVQAEILATGLFEPLPGSEADDDFQPGGGGPGGDGYIQVRNGDRLVLAPGAPAQVGQPEFDRLVERLTDLPSWLPASAWQDRAIRAYVPSRYAICRYSGPAPPAWSRVLPLLPAPARELLADARPFRWDDHGPAGAGTCFDVTTEEARAVAEALDDAGIRPVIDSPFLAYQLGFIDQIGYIGIDFLPFLPDGVPSFPDGLPATTTGE